MLRAGVGCLMLCAALLGGLKADDKSPDDQPTSPYSCRAGPLPTSWGFDNPPGSIEHHYISFDESGQAALNFDFRNLQPAPIEALALVIEYIDKTGQVIDRVPVASVAHGVGNRFHSPFAVEAIGGWQHAVSPGDSAVNVGVT